MHHADFDEAFFTKIVFNKNSVENTGHCDQVFINKKQGAVKLFCVYTQDRKYFRSNDYPGWLPYKLANSYCISNDNLSETYYTCVVIILISNNHNFSVAEWRFSYENKQMLIMLIMFPPIPFRF